MSLSPKTILKRNFSQFFRFGGVGILNTLIDFSITNTLVLLTQANSTLLLMLISLFACLIATLNSYICNKKWTFKDSSRTNSSTTILKFYLISLIAALINTSIFLFFYHYLTEQYEWQKILVVNVSKLIGVSIASAVSFIGFKLHVFDRGNLKEFRERFTFEDSPSKAWIQLSALIVCACLIRILYLSITTPVFGDGVTYANLAQNIAQGNFSAIDPFWLNLFCFWEALFPLLGFSAAASAILASCIPGILLVIPVVIMTRTLYGDRVAWIAGLLTISHPRLVEYSCNGYAETFYLLCLTSAVMWLVLEGSLLSGMAFGLAFAVRNEAMFIMALCLLGLYKSHRPYRRLTTIALGFVLVLIPYLVGAEYITGTTGLFKKTSNFYSPSEQLDWYAGAQETYGIKSQDEPKSNIITFFKHIKANILYTLQRFPGVLITPTGLFALLLPFLARERRFRVLWPLLVLLFFPLVFYPLVRVAPLHFFPMLIPIQIFGAAGLLAFCTYLKERLRAWPIVQLVGGSILAFSLVVIVFRARDIEQNYSVHRMMAHWIQRHISPNALILGDGFGYAATTAFLAHHPSQPRLWTTDPHVLVDSVRKKNGHWLILYEEFLKKSNPELLPALTQGLPDMSMRYEVRDRKGNRVQIFELSTKSIPSVEGRKSVVPHRSDTDS